MYQKKKRKKYEKVEKMAVCRTGSGNFGTGSGERTSYSKCQSVCADDRSGTVVREEQKERKTTKKTNPKAWQKMDGVCYNGSGEKIPGAITRGIDVSEWQDTINWAKVKKYNVVFAMIRIAYGTGYPRQNV